MAATPKPHPCCNVAENLFIESPARPIEGKLANGTPIKGTAITRKCKVCGARHHEAKPEPGHFGIKMK